jgi:Flp pilus assembly protein TadG
MSIKNTISRWLGSIASSEKGSVGMIFGGTLVPVIILAGAAIDYGSAVRAKAALQIATDSAALAGASLLAASEERREALAKSVFTANLPAHMQSTVPVVTSTIESVSVTASYTAPMAFMKLANINSVTVGTNANVSIDTTVVDGSICMLALGTQANLQGIHLDGNSTIADHRCWAWSNAAGFDSLDAGGSSQATAAGFCAAGGAVGGTRFSPAPLEGCATRPDPFASLVIPTVGSNCDHDGKKYNNGTHTMSPGVYCNGIEIKPQAVVTMEPGVYFLNGGVLDVKAQSTLQGSGVTIIFTGLYDRMEINGGGNIDLKAPTTGALAGFLFVDARNEWHIYSHKILGGGSIKMQGILYAPTRQIEVGGNGDINQESLYFAMVAKNFHLYGTGDIFLKIEHAAAGFPDILPKVKRLTRMTQ